MEVSGEIMSVSTRILTAIGLGGFAAVVAAYAVWWPAGVALALVLGVAAVLLLHRRVDRAARFELDRERITGADWVEQLAA